MATILVVDDNRANREALGALLEGAGHCVVHAADGREALARAQEARPELVIADVLMPMMDGYELARRLKADPATAGAALIFYTAYFSGQNALALAQAHGVSRVLLKPLENAEILREVDAALALGKAPAQIARGLARGHLRLMVDQLLERTGALEAHQQRMDYLADHDPLTGLPNRSLFSDRLTQALNAARREKRFAAAIFGDVERFHRVNESFGRKGGDNLLREIGTRLRRAAREQDTVARVGANRFAIAVGPSDRAGDIALALDSFDQALARPIAIEGVELRVALKAGIAVFPADGESTEALCANAETALAQAKKTGSRYLFYAPEMNARVAESLAMEQRLRRALDNDRLALHYQPKIDMASGAVAGLEALLRWHDPDLGPVPPARFVPLLEETGMILAAGRWALRRTVEDIRRWQGLGLKVPRTSVNVSAVQLRQKDFVDSVLDPISRSSGNASLLDLEITESVLLDDIEEGTRKLQALRRAGVEVSVDDFGTGYCSLRYLARLPVDTLKIDRSFVVLMRETGYARNIVAMIVSLAHTLGLRVVAEGVEDGEQARLLRELGCDQFQGFYFSRAVPPEEIDAMLSVGANRASKRAKLSAV